MQRHPVEQWVGMINYDLQNSRDEEWVLRTRGDEVLGVVSGSYKKFDNQSVVKALIDNLGEDSPVHRYHLDDKFFFVRALYPGGDFKIDGEGEGVYHVGFTIFNSEVGFRSLGTAAFIYKKTCQNDAQFQTHTRMNFRHVGHTFEEMSGGLRQAISAGKRLKTFYAGLVRKASQEVIEGEAVKSVMAEVRSLLRLSKKRADEISQLYAEEPKTKMGIVNAITHYAQRLEGDQRFFLEAGAGSLLEVAIPIGRG